MGQKTDSAVSAMTTSVRDKLVISALIIFGICAFITIWIDRSTAASMIGFLASIVTGLAAFYKGTPSPDSASPTASVTSTTETSTKETVSDSKGQESAAPIPTGGT